MIYCLQSRRVSGVDASTDGAITNGRLEGARDGDLGVTRPCSIERDLDRLRPPAVDLCRIPSLLR